MREFLVEHLKQNSENKMNKKCKRKCFTTFGGNCDDSRTWWHSRDYSAQSARSLLGNISKSRRSEGKEVAERNSIDKFLSSSFNPDLTPLNTHAPSNNKKNVAFVLVFSSFYRIFLYLFFYRFNPKSWIRRRAQRPLPFVSHNLFINQSKRLFFKCFNLNWFILRIDPWAASLRGGGCERGESLTKRQW